MTVWTYDRKYAPKPDPETEKCAVPIYGRIAQMLVEIRRDGLLSTLEGIPSYSRREVESIAADPWLSARNEI